MIFGWITVSSTAGMVVTGFEASWLQASLGRQNRDTIIRIEKIRNISKIYLTDQYTLHKINVNTIQLSTKQTNMNLKYDLSSTYGLKINSSKKIGVPKDPKI
jgi:hypothetical protein